MGASGPWNWRLTGPKTIKMTLVRPPMTNLKVTVRADCCFCMYCPTSVKALAHWLPVVLVGSWPLDRRPPPSLWAAAIWNKAKFPFHQRGLFIGFGAVSSRTPRSFGNRITEETKILPILLTEYVFTGTTNKYFIKKKKLQSDYHQNLFFLVNVWF